jgi:cell division protein ZapA (FtsZ GTPase activity inhibitor)
MTETSREQEFNILGCRVKYKPDEQDRDVAISVVEQVIFEVNALRNKNPGLRDTDVAVLIALKIATEKKNVEKELANLLDTVENNLQLVLSN